MRHNEKQTLDDHLDKYPDNLDFHEVLQLVGFESKRVIIKEGVEYKKWELTYKMRSYNLGLLLEELEDVYLSAQPILDRLKKGVK